MNVVPARRSHQDSRSRRRQFHSVVFWRIVRVHPADVVAIVLLSGHHIDTSADTQPQQPARRPPLQAKLTQYRTLPVHSTPKTLELNPLSAVDQACHAPVYERPQALRPANGKLDPAVRRIYPGHGNGLSASQGTVWSSATSKIDHGKMIFE